MDIHLIQIGVASITPKDFRIDAARGTLSSLSVEKQNCNCDCKSRY